MIDFIGLELIQFHDLPLNSIRIHSEPEAKLEIEISVYDEERSEYQANLETIKKSPADSISL